MSYRGFTGGLIATLSGSGLGIIRPVPALTSERPESIGSRQERDYEKVAIIIDLLESCGCFVRSSASEDAVMAFHHEVAAAA
jgi:hypothetical protein